MLTLYDVISLALPLSITVVVLSGWVLYLNELGVYRKIKGKFNDISVITKYKTTSLIKLANNTDLLIVCFSRKEAARIFKVANDRKCNIHMPITYDDMLVSKYRSKRHQVLLIDNMEFLFNYITRGRCKSFTVSEDFIKTLKRT